MSATIIAFFNVKGGVGKTTATANFAFILANDYNKRVLIVDGDQQANTTEFFNAYNEEDTSISDLLINSEIDIHTVIKKTGYNSIDIIPSNMSLFAANKVVLTDTLTIQQTRLKNHIEVVLDEYDYIICDCPPNVDMSAVNIISMSEDVIIPIKVDKYSMKGIDLVIRTVSSLKTFNQKLHIEGSFVNMFVRSAINSGGYEAAKLRPDLRCYNTIVRNTVKVSESTYHTPIADYDPKSTAAQDFRSLVAEYLERKKQRGVVLNG